MKVWLKITWPLLVRAVPLALLGVLFAFSSSPGIALFGVVLFCFAVYWIYVGARPAPERED